MTLKKSRTPHCVVGENSLRCTHCGEEVKLPMPISINMFTAMSKAFIKDHKSCKPTQKGAERMDFTTFDAWAASWDTGISSKHIFRVCTGRPVSGTTHGRPRDGSDFGRCYRLLKAFPELRDAFNERMGKDDPLWQPLVDAWDELTALYEKEHPSGKCPKLYKRLCELNKE